MEFWDSVIGFFSWFLKKESEDEESEDNEESVDEEETDL